MGEGGNGAEAVPEEPVALLETRSGATETRRRFQLTTGFTRTGSTCIPESTAILRALKKTCKSTKFDFTTTSTEGRQSQYVCEHVSTCEADTVHEIIDAFMNEAQKIQTKLESTSKLVKLHVEPVS